MFLIHSPRFGYVCDFDGEDYRWTPHKEQANRMVRMAATLHFNRLSAYVEDADIISESEPCS